MKGSIMKEGSKYKFEFYDFETPFGQTIKEEPKVRTYQSTITKDNIPFYQVFNEARKVSHLIAIETVKNVTAV